MSERIRWAAEPRRQQGHVGKLRLFSITQGVSGDLYLHTSLPGFGRPRPVGDVEEGKQIAEKFLAEFVDGLGASFPADTPSPDPITT